MCPHADRSWVGAPTRISVTGNRRNPRHAQPTHNPVEVIVETSENTPPHATAAVAECCNATNPAAHAIRCTPAHHNPTCPNNRRTTGSEVIASGRCTKSATNRNGIGRTHNAETAHSTDTDAVITIGCNRYMYIDPTSNDTTVRAVKIDEDNTTAVGIRRARTHRTSTAPNRHPSTAHSPPIAPTVLIATSSSTVGTTTVSIANQTALVTMPRKCPASTRIRARCPARNLGCGRSAAATAAGAGIEIAIRKARLHGRQGLLRPARRWHGYRCVWTRP